eukprot:NP_001033578.1 Uncharacterized protein CELE_ZK380.5 [Caenorhabditis elegans]
MATGKFEKVFFFQTQVLDKSTMFLFCAPKISIPLDGVLRHFNDVDELVARLRRWRDGIRRDIEWSRRFIDCLRHARGDLLNKTRQENRELRKIILNLEALDEIEGLIRARINASGLLAIQVTIQVPPCLVSSPFKL